jgi:hypothetical protein
MLSGSIPELNSTYLLHWLSTVIIDWAIGSKEKGAGRFFWGAEEKISS